MTTRCKVAILHKATQQYVDAELIDGVTADEVNAAEAAWRPVLDEELKRMANESVPANRRPEHAHWDWRHKCEVTEGLLVYQMLGIEHDSKMQGLMLVQTAGVFCRLPNQKDKGLVYVMFIATAPWNSPVVVANPRFGQVGTVLIAAATQISLDLGFNGRVGLHSLPQSEDWYEKDMTDVGIDLKKNLRYFEMTPEQANNFIR